MIVVEVLLLAAVLFGVAAVAAGRGDFLAEAPRDAADSGFSADRPLEAADLADVRFPMALRGYRMAEVDEALARLADELADRDQRIAEYDRRIAELDSARRSDVMPAAAPASAGQPEERDTLWRR
ncbi:MAG: DivIVA domain-containing protein, partial [Mycobacteriales bacterium]